MGVHTGGLAALREMNPALTIQGQAVNSSAAKLSPAAPWTGPGASGASDCCRSNERPSMCGTRECTLQNPLVLHSQRNRKRAAPIEAEKENTSPACRLWGGLGKACCLHGTWPALSVWLCGHGRPAIGGDATYGLVQQVAGLGSSIPGQAVGDLWEVPD